LEYEREDTILQDERTSNRRDKEILGSKNEVILMALEKIAIGPNVMFIDRQNSLLFSHGEVKKARERFANETAKLQSKQG